MLPIKLAGLGLYLPRRKVPSENLEAELGLPAGWIAKLTGVRERRRAESETSAGMGAAAARMALEHAGIRGDEIDLIIGASTGPQQLIPCTAALVQRELGLGQGGRSLCFDLDTTCLSFLVALHTAAQFVAAGVYRNVLIYSSEITSRTLNAREPESYSLFGDAAAAAVVTASGPGETGRMWHARFATYSEGADLTQCLGGGTLHHPNDPTTTPEMNTFHMRGTAIFKMALRLMGPFLQQFLDTVAWDQAGIDAVVPHQASLLALNQLTARLGFRPEQLVLNLAERGNCIAASLPLALAEAVHAGRIQRGDRVVLLGTGAGLTLGAMALSF
jgi:3-oxoacyl-[acyl-carrier-protein] synthase-3